MGIRKRKYFPFFASSSLMVIYPIIIVLFTVPYIAWSYHKYGSVLSLRVLIVYSFILYLLCVYCLVILPLPTPERAATLHGHKVQLIPFSFIADIAKQSQTQPGQPASWLSIFTGSAFWTTVFNLFMTMPFGVYLRYYFCYNWRKTLRLSFLLSLFFELTQLSGLYFVYPGSYRLFDVDDLIVNTTGSMIGFALAGSVSRLLPTRQELDTVSFRRGASISFTRRVFSFLADMACLIFISGILAVVVVSFGITLSIQWMPVLFLLYFGLLPIFCHGQTPGKRLTRMKIVQRKLGFNIHNYFFAKALDQVRPGGVVAFVTSRYTMDAKDSTVRRYLAQRAELLGAIRLPNNAFRANAGTDVVSDILFLQKRDRPLDIAPDWTQTGRTEEGFTVNQYFLDHPEMVLGRPTAESTQYGNAWTISCRFGGTARPTS